MYFFQQIQETEFHFKKFLRYCDLIHWKCQQATLAFTIQEHLDKKIVMSCYLTRQMKL